MLSAAEKKSAQVYRWLLAYIDENKFSGNQRLPSENALCRKLGVSRETIRVAIDQLVAEGLVYKLKGSGTYFHREKVMTRDLNTDDALYKIGLVLQGQDTSANSGLIEGVRSVLTQEQVDLHVFLTDNKFCNAAVWRLWYIRIFTVSSWMVSNRASSAQILTATRNFIGAKFR